MCTAIGITGGGRQGGADQRGLVGLSGAYVATGASIIRSRLPAAFFKFLTAAARAGIVAPYFFADRMWGLLGLSGFIGLRVFAVNVIPLLVLTDGFTDEPGFFVEAEGLLTVKVSGLELNKSFAIVCDFTADHVQFQPLAMDGLGNGITVLLGLAARMVGSNNKINQPQHMGAVSGAHQLFRMPGVTRVKMDWLAAGRQQLLAATGTKLGCGGHELVG